MTERTREELADILNRVAKRFLNSSPEEGWRGYAKHLDEAAQRLREMPDGERIGYVPLAAFRTAAAATGEHSYPMVPAALTPIWQDSVPVFLHTQEPTAQKRTEHPVSSEEENDATT